MTVAGITPRTIVEPQTLDDLALCVADLYAHNLAFAVCGGGTELELGNAPHALDTLVKSTACNRVVDYAPQDQTITVEAGMTLQAVNDVLSPKRQFLAIDAPQADRTTIGGAIATNAFGRRRLRYGSIKDTIVGVEFVRPDGVRARGGGKVVKTVAGFDMPKLMVGALGTLGAIASATFRVHPIEEERAALTYRALSVEDVALVCREIVADALVPAGVVAYSTGDGQRYDCSVIFEGFARGVEQQLTAATSIAFRSRLSAGAYALPFEADFDARERAVRRGCAWCVTLSARPTELLRFLAATPFSPTAERVVYPLIGTAFVAEQTLDARTIADWRAKLDGGSVVVNIMPPSARAAVESWGAPSSSSFAIMRRLKDLFDPKGLCNAGRFVGGL